MVPNRDGAPVFYNSAFVCLPRKRICGGVCLQPTTTGIWPISILLEENGIFDAVLDRITAIPLKGNSLIFVQEEYSSDEYNQRRRS